jgi:hypothetical protein
VINSWKDLIYTLDQMRQLQKNPNTSRSLELRFRLSRAEAEVDACVAAKVSEWAAARQPELTVGEENNETNGA